jgi:hypothetical protein
LKWIVYFSMKWGCEIKVAKNFELHDYFRDCN